MNDASRRQIEAAQPDKSTWLSANAGSGKTRVLTDRVARLLLEGVTPQNILCLTYTKAAASEMQNRLFKTLGGWAMLAEDDLRTRLEDLTGGRHVPTEKLTDARRLFAKAVETPGGLRIQTIHSFCAILLRKFPLEARVSPQFTEMDDRNAQLLRTQCLEEMAERHPDILLDMAMVMNGGDVEPFVAALTSERDAFRNRLDEGALRTRLELPPDLALDQLIAMVFEPGIVALMRRVGTAMHTYGGTNDQKAAPSLFDVEADPAGLVILEKLLLTGAGAKEPFSAKIGKFPTSASRKTLDDDDAAELDNLMERVETARGPRLALATLDQNLTLQAFAAAFLPIYDRAKTDRGWLDFDDLILKARDLLSDSDAAQWVLYRLDGAIDHVLIDEAQDTAPAQWQMIEALAQEAASGDGTRPTGARTVFVVGDKKQSIYSFQGADPEGFDRMLGRFRAQLGHDAISQLEMLHSFRSSSAILDVVDATFASTGMKHIAFHENLPGRVDLWPLVEAGEAGEPPNFDDPVDIVSPADAVEVLAGQIAGRVADMVATQAIPDPEKPGAFRPMHAGDVLILFQSRGPLFNATIRACKASGIPMAGADRLSLSAELAVKDIQALLSFLATPEDSLSLAAALKSPLFGWDEQALFDLAAKRPQRHLWEALRARAGSCPETMAMIDDLRTQAGYLRPFELIERILTRHRGRAKLVGRLGPECEEAIDALLSQSLLYERSDIPSLTGFLAWLEGDDIQIKRQSESRGTNLRIMTIHGAKGLEAPVVILPDTMKEPRNRTGELWPAGEGFRVLQQSKDTVPPGLQDARATVEAKQAAERDRLLYVAMTRAQFWLIVAGAGEEKAGGGRWYGQIAHGLQELELRHLSDPEGAQRYEVGNWDSYDVPRVPTADSDQPGNALPDWIDSAIAPPEDVFRLYSPSKLGGAKVLPSELEVSDDQTHIALDRGTALHALLEHLPPDNPGQWSDLALRILPHLDTDQRSARLAEAERVLRDPGILDLFRRPALTEIAVTAPLPGGAITGAIDRLIIAPDRVLAIDYKSNRVVPDTVETVPDGLLRQMGAYHYALSRIYPDLHVETALLWTEVPRLMKLPTELVRDAFLASVDLDAPKGSA